MSGRFVLIFRFLRNILGLFIGLVALYFVAALILSLLSTHPPEPDCNPDRQIYITTNGVHLDIILPKQHIDPDFASQLDLTENIEYVSFGWGDKQFYINTPEWSDLTIPVAFQALFLKSETAMHVTRLTATQSSWNKLNICDIQLNELIHYIKKSFDKNDLGKLIKIDVKGYGNNDHFYEAKNSFSLFQTCNSWVNKALKEINVQTSVWSPFDFGVLYHLL